LEVSAQGPTLNDSENLGWFKKTENSGSSNNTRLNKEFNYNLVLYQYCNLKLLINYGNLID